MAWFGNGSSQTAIERLEEVVKDQGGERLEEFWLHPEVLKWRRLMLVVWYNNDTFPTLKWIYTTDEMYKFRNEELPMLRLNSPMAAFTVDRERLERDGRLANILQDLRQTWYA